MKHGPIALIDERMPVVTIAPHDAVFEKMIGNMQEVKARGGSVVALTTRGDDKLQVDSRPLDRLHPRAARDTGAADAHRDDHSAAVARVRHRRASRLRRGPAAESGQERHGRVTADRDQDRGSGSGSGIGESDRVSDAASGLQTRRRPTDSAARSTMVSLSIGRGWSACGALRPRSRSDPDPDS